MRNSIYLFIFVIFSFISCREKENCYYITYHISLINSNNNEIYISYEDSIGRVIVRTNKNWSKKVCLPAGKNAFLLAYPINNPEIEDNKHLSSKVRGEGKSFYLVGDIQYKDEIIRDKSESVIVLSLVP